MPERRCRAYRAAVPSRDFTIRRPSAAARRARAATPAAETATMMASAATRAPRRDRRAPSRSIAAVGADGGVGLGDRRTRQLRNRQRATRSPPASSPASRPVPSTIAELPDADAGLIAGAQPDRAQHRDLAAARPQLRASGCGDADERQDPADRGSGPEGDRRRARAPGGRPGRRRKRSARSRGTTVADLLATAWSGSAADDPDVARPGRLLGDPQLVVLDDRQVHEERRVGRGAGDRGDDADDLGVQPVERRPAGGTTRCRRRRRRRSRRAAARHEDGRRDAVVEGPVERRGEPHARACRSRRRNRARCRPSSGGENCRTGSPGASTGRAGCRPSPASVVAVSERHDEVGERVDSDDRRLAAIWSPSTAPAMVPARPPGSGGTSAP